MRRATRPPVDLGVYLRAIPLLLRNPSIVVVPLLMAVIGILIGMVMTPGAGMGGGLIGSLTSGLGGFVVILLELFGLGTACIIADDAWRYGHASFDKGWTEARRRAGEILFAALGVTLLLAVGQYAGALLGFAIGPVPVGLVLIALIALFLIWAIPAAASGGMRGGEAIQVSVDRVRANPLS
ncbi:MAG: hypothetical protein JOZ24_06575, partial [Candidatus Eremiobacteraeota bacterium]|nr:hypothetical protein [Candidatus Eremiobacteraeota bacterium]